MKRSTDKAGRFTKSFRRIVREAMDAKGMTQDDLAKKLGVTKQGVSRHLSGDISPTMRTVERYFKALRIKVEMQEVK